MDDHDHAYDAFTSSHLWQASSLYEDPATFESSLFAPIQLDGMFARLLRTRQTASNRVQFPQSSSTTRMHLRNRLTKNCNCQT